jgi:hypothetical protein
MVLFMTTRILSQDGEPKKQVAVERKMSLFGQSIPFAQAFPMLAGLETTVWIRPHGRTEENPQEQHFGLRNPPGEHIHCPKKGCTNGGWRIGDVMRDMIARRETHQIVEGKCNGRQWVVGPKYRDCATHFTAEIVLAYKPEAVKVAAWL